MKSFKKILDKSISLAGTRAASKLLFFLSFAESIFFPVPIDPLLGACVIAKPSKTFQITTITLFFSVFGGVVGWVIGYFLGSGLELFIQNYPIFSEEKFNDFKIKFNNWGVLVVFIGAFTPLPYKVIAISAGASGIFLPIFIIGSLLGRGIRFYFVSYLAYYFGESGINFINKHLTLSSIIIAVIIIIICLIIF